MATIGVIGGSGLLATGDHGAAAEGKSDGDSRSPFAALPQAAVDTPYGSVLVHQGDVHVPGTGGRESLRVAFVQRHAADPSATYTQPADVNYPAIAAALKRCGAAAVVGFASVGALQLDKPVGTLCVPDDYFCPWDIRRGTSGFGAHHMPGYDGALRSRLLKAARATAAKARDGDAPNVVDGGTYVNSRGPRFETPSEIRFMGQHGAYVGMTGAHEATACGEEGLPYASVGIIDNVANGLSKPAASDVDATALTLESFKAAQRRNKATLLRLVDAVIAQFAASPLASDGAAGSGSGDGAAAAGAGDAKPKAPCAVLVHARHVVPVDTPEGDLRALENHAVAVGADGRILAVLPSAEATATYDAAEVVTLAEHVLMPGLVNAHTHASMSLLRGVDDDTPLIKWLTEAIWPAEGKLVGKEGFVADGARHAFAEMLRGGTTTVNDMYFFGGEVARVAVEVGVRVVVGHTVLDFPTVYGSGPEEYLEKGRAVHAKWSDEPLVSFTVAPHAPYTVSDSTMTKVKALAEELDVPIHIHLHETAAECADSVAQTEGSMSKHLSPEKCRPFANLDRLGLVGPRLVAAHSVHFTDAEIARLAEAGGTAVHCPSSNLKLASGFAPVSKMLAAGVNVAIGTDGAASNNTLDMLSELRLAAILAKGVSGDATSVPASTAIRMATINGARAVGKLADIGSLEAGKWADMTALRLDTPEALPVYDVVSHLVYVLNRESVTDTWVAGQRVYRNGALTTIDTAAVVAASDKWRPQVVAAIAKPAGEGEDAGEGGDKK